MAERTKPSEPMVCVAAVAAPHGIQGALKLRTFTERPENVVAYGPVYDGQGRRLFELELIRPTKGGVIARIPGIEDRNEAERWRGVRFYVPRAVLPAPEAEEFYVEDLQGLPVERRDGTRMGRVLGLDNYGAGDVIEVGLDSGGSVVLPFTREVVPEVDLERGRLVVEPPPELVPAGGERR
jgi:16S rRNA processing protein RimM